MKNFLSVLCVVLALTLIFCGCSQKTRDDIGDGVKDGVDDIENGINDVLPDSTDPGDKDGVDILPSDNGGTDSGTDGNSNANDSGVGNAGTDSTGNGSGSNGGATLPAESATPSPSASPSTGSDQ